MGAVIQADHHIRVVAHLELDGFFRSELVFTTAPLRLKGDSPTVHPAEFWVLPDEGIRLEPTRIGNDWAVPAGHRMQPTQRPDHIRAGFLHQVESIHHHSLNPHHFQVSGVHCAHHPKSGIGQEDRVSQGAVWKDEGALSHL